MQADYLFDRLLIQPPLRLTTLAQTSLHAIAADMRVAMVAPMERAGCGGGHASWSFDSLMYFAALSIACSTLP